VNGGLAFQASCPVSTSSTPGTLLRLSCCRDGVCGACTGPLSVKCWLRRRPLEVREVEPLAGRESREHTCPVQVLTVAFLEHWHSDGALPRRAALPQLRVHPHDSSRSLRVLYVSQRPALASLIWSSFLQLHARYPAFDLARRTTIFVISKCESGQTQAVEARIHQLVHVLSVHQCPKPSRQAIEYLKVRAEPKQHFAINCLCFCTFRGATTTTSSLTTARQQRSCAPQLRTTSRSSCSSQQLFRCRSSQAAVASSRSGDKSGRVAQETLGLPCTSSIGGYSPS
jgi:hypothetical protein